MQHFNTNKLSIFISFLLVIIATSCDYIENPIPKKNENIGDTSTCTSPTFAVISNHVKKILIEDYTGHKCPNCPKAAKELYKIDTTYPGQIIELAIHVTNTFASPTTPSGAPSGSFLSDYRTNIGNTYDAFFAVSQSGLPKGMINRLDYSTAHKKNWPQWRTFVDGIINNPPTAGIQIINDFDNTTNKLCSHIKTNFLSNTSGVYKLVVLLVQDSIIDWQEDGSLADPYIPQYVHRHVLRDAINSAWGDTIAQGNININQSVVKKYAYNIPSNFNGISCNIDNCYVVAFVYNASTYEILQAEEEKVK